VTSTIAFALIALTGAVVATVGFSWVFAHRWGRPARQVSDETPADHGLTHVLVAFTSHDKTINGWLIEPAASRYPTVIVPHGWGSNAARMLPLATVLQTEGFGVFLYDTRGHGGTGTDGPVTIRTFTEDLLAAVDHLSQRTDVDPTRIGVLGHSMGGAAAIVAASTEPRIRVVVASAAFAHIDELTGRTLRRLHLPQWPFLPLVRRVVELHLDATTSDFSPRNRIGDIDVPVLLGHGADDEVIPAADLDVLHAAAQPATTERVLVPHRNHGDLLADPSYSARVLDFLHRTLNSQRLARLDE
jgi:dipeptidyl aminopeptidase/acylaminoacyl peptidase